MTGERGAREGTEEATHEVTPHETALERGRRTGAMRVETVSAATFDAVLRLQVAPRQRQFVASNVLSLAQAWLWPSARPLALLVEGVPVGFALVDTTPASPRTATLVRFMVDEGQQGRGFGRRGLAALLALLDAEGYTHMRLSYVPGNTTARRLYAEAGFAETGERDGEEAVMRLRLPGAAVPSGRRTPSDPAP